MDPAVIIVGAGAAGLAAARALAQAGLSCLILEARRRAGGRIHTLHEALFSTPVELGAEFVHGKPRQIWGAVDAGELRAIETQGTDWMFRDGRLERPDAMFQATEPVMKDLPNAAEQSFAQFVNSRGDGNARRWAKRYIEGFHAARTEEIGVYGLAAANRAEDAIEGDRTFRLEGGYQSLLEWLQNGVTAEIRYGAVVTSVAWRRGRVDVRADSGEFHAPRLICTVPIGVLAERAVRFEPEPDRLRAAMNAIAMGTRHASRCGFGARYGKTEASFAALDFFSPKSRQCPPGGRPRRRTRL